MIVGAEAGIAMESRQLRGWLYATGRLSVDVDAAQPVDQFRLLLSYPGGIKVG